MLQLSGPPEEAAAQLIAHLQAKGVFDARGELYAEPRMAVNSVKLLKERLRTRATSGRDAATQTSASSSSSSSSSGRGASDSRFQEASPVVPRAGKSGVLLADERHGEPSPAR